MKLMSNTTRWFGEGIGTVVRSLTAPPRLPSSARAVPAPAAAKATTIRENMNQPLGIMVGSSFSVVADAVDDGQPIRIVADASDRRDLAARTEIDHEDRPAGRNRRSLAGAAGHHGVAAVGRHGDSLRSRRLAVRAHERDPCDFAIEPVDGGEGPAEIHDRYVVGPEIGHHD